MDSRTKKTNNKRFVRYSEGAEMYSMSVSKFMQLAKDAKACYITGKYSGRGYTRKRIEQF